jgi:hypothetical protein
MSTNLYRMSRISWAVTSSRETEPQVFTSIEEAADYLESVGIPDSEIDIALAEMFAQGHTRAQFGVMNGAFTFSDNERLHDILGIA